jgi:TPR repeat protein
MRVRSIVFTFAALSFSVLNAADYSAGLKAYQKKDYGTAHKEWGPLAKQGNPDALYGLGTMYDNGEGVPQDHKKAMGYYLQAAQQGHAWAQTDLATIYYDGKGVAQDYSQAFRWYTLAANQGNSQAQLNLGVMYGVGQGTKTDLVTAYMWATLAGAGGEQKGASLQASLAKQMQPGQIAKAKELARQFKPKAAAPVK